MHRLIAFTTSLSSPLIHLRPSFRSQSNQIRCKLSSPRSLQTTSVSDGQLINRVLTHWYGDRNPPRYETFHDRNQLWYFSTPQQDAHIRHEFHSDVTKALEGSYDHLITSEKFPVHGPLALLVLLDQYPRNIFRKTARAFAGDERALAVVQHVLKHRWPEAKESLGPIVRCAFLLPLMHQEEVQHLDACVDLAEEMREECRQAGEQGEGCAQVLTQTIEFAELHRGILRRFSRYPHRNEILGRECTPEEVEFMETGPRFGQ